MSSTHDLRFAVRMLIRDRWVTLLAVVALGLGIGVNNTVFTCVNAVLLRGLPFEDSHRIMFLTARNLTQGQDSMRVSYPDFLDWRESTRSFSDLAAYTNGSMNLSDGEHAAERVAGAWVTANTFSLVGQEPLLGRDFAPGEDVRGAAPVALIGYGVWMNRYGGDPGVLGRTIRVNEVPATIIGVMPEGMRFPGFEDMWLPYAEGAQRDQRGRRVLGVFGRLAEGVGLDEARTDMSGIAARLAQQHPDTNDGVDAFVQPYNDQFNGGSIKVVFLALMGAVGFVLLIACANVANLLLARSAYRAREIAVRTALGATRTRLVRQLLAECVLLGIVSGLVGLGLSLVGVRWFASAVENVGKPYWIQFTMDWRVFLFFLVVCLGTGVVFGLAPALHGSGIDVNQTLQQGGRSGATGRGTRRFTRAMVVVQLTLTAVLLFGAALMTRSFLKLYQMQIGVTTDGVLTAQLRLPDRKYPGASDRLAFHERLSEQLAASPGVESAGVVSRLPLSGAASRELFIETRPIDPAERAPDVSVVIASPGYFQTMRATVLRGRDFGDTDGAPGSQAVIVNERLAALHFQGAEPLGQRLRLRADGEDEVGPWLTVVGVAPTIRQRSFQEVDPDAVVYLPYRQEPVPFAIVLARGRLRASALTEAVRQAVRDVDPDLPVFSVQTLDETMIERRWAFRVFGSLFGVFALIALVLAGVGIYGVMAYTVSQRRQEIGIRVMLGASSGDVTRLIVKQALVELAVGLALGIAGALGAGQVLSSLLVQITPSDPTALASVASLLVTVSTAACLLPARRAARVSAVNTLRES